MEIVEIIECGKSRSKIKLDTGENFVLYRGEIKMLHIKEGSELSQTVYDNILKGILPKRCKMRALNLLKERPYTEYQLSTKLSDGGYPDDVVAGTLSYVKSYGYVNDREYAHSYIAEKVSKTSINEIKVKLLQKGIEKEVIEEAIYEYRNESGIDSETSEYEAIEKLLKKRGYSFDASYEERQKQLAYFYRRGFNTEIVKKVMESQKF